MAKNDFKIVAADGKARAGVLVTSHGAVETPVFMPVGTQATIKGVPHDILNCPVILSNAYYLYLKPGIQVLKKFGGLHKFMNWKHSILTDSGGFQIFSLAALFKIHEGGVEFRSKFDGSRHFLTPADVIDVQIALGSDIMMVLDRCVEYPQPLAVIERAAAQTVKWAEESVKHFGSRKTNQKLFAIVQGGTDAALRRRCSEELYVLPFDGFAVGGLGVGEPRSLRREVLEETLGFLDPLRPRYVMGMGPADEIWEAVEAGADMFDCVMPTRNGRNGQAFTFSGKLNLRNAKFKEDEKPLEQGCSCPACRSYSRAYIHHLFNVGEMLAQTLASLHNINFMLNLMNLIRNSIKENAFQKEKKKFLKLWRNDAI
ncbi:MAG: tRNA guanosine(34) transglycosylase Tgt [bacterium]